VIDCNEWRTEKRHECANMGKVKRLELWWQLYRTSLPVWDLENFRPMDFCWHECTKPGGPAPGICSPLVWKARLQIQIWRRDLPNTNTGQFPPDHNVQPPARLTLTHLSSSHVHSKKYSSHIHHLSSSPFRPVTVPQWRTEGGGLGCSNPPPPEIPKISVKSSIAWAKRTGVSISFCSSLCSHTVVIY